MSAEHPKRSKQRVVILGSGWAAISLLRELDNDAYEVGNLILKFLLCLALTISLDCGDFAA